MSLHLTRMTGTALRAQAQRVPARATIASVSVAGLSVIKRIVLPELRFAPAPRI